VVEDDSKTVEGEIWFKFRKVVFGVEELAKWLL
jgi:hypothetical protein